MYSILCEISFTNYIIQTFYSIYLGKFFLRLLSIRGYRLQQSFVYDRYVHSTPSSISVCIHVFILGEISFRPNYVLVCALAQVIVVVEKTWIKKGVQSGKYTVVSACACLSDTRTHYCLRSRGGNLHTVTRLPIKECRGRKRKQTCL